MTLESSTFVKLLTTLKTYDYELENFRLENNIKDEESLIEKYCSRQKIESWKQIPEKQIFTGVVEKIMSRVASEFSLPNSGIEIGAGPLKNGKSRLMKLLPLRMDHIEPTDLVSPDNFELTHHAMRHLDVTQISSILKKESQDLIIGSSVLSVLKYEDLEKAIRGSYLTLKPNGIALHIADGLPSAIPLLLHCQKQYPNYIPFPWISHESGFCLVSKDELFKMLAQAKMKALILPQVTEFFEYYINMKTDVRQMTIWNLMSVQVQEALVLSDFISELKFKDKVNVENYKTFQDLSLRYFQSAGFQDCKAVTYTENEILTPLPPSIPEKLKAIKKMLKNPGSTETQHVQTHFANLKKIFQEAIGQNPIYASKFQEFLTHLHHGSLKELLMDVKQLLKKEKLYHTTRKISLSNAGIPNCFKALNGVITGENLYVFRPGVYQVSTNVRVLYARK